jgi:hypothetical protein
MEQLLIAGYIMAIAGFFIILIKAMNYIFHGDLRSPAFTIPGLF